MTTIDLPRDSTLERVADSLAILASSKASEMTMDWPTLARLVKTGGAKSILSIGDLIEESWTDKSPAEPKAYSLPWGVRHFGTVELEDGKTTNGLFLQTHYATVKACQFSHSRAFLRCPDGLAAGTYYITFFDTYGKLVKDELFCFTLTQDVPAGGRVAGLTYAAWDSPKENWRVSSYDESGVNIIETVTPTFEADGTHLGGMYISKRNGDLNSMHEMCYGWNCWAKSAYRQYLNSSADKGKWWTAQDGWDIKPDQLDQIPGFLSGLPQELIDAMLPVKTRTYYNTVNDAAEFGADYVDTYDKVFLPSLEQMFIAPQISGEGETWDYWKLIAGVGGQFKQYGTYEKLRSYATENRTSAQYVRLRSAYRGYGCSVWCVNPSGNVGYNYACRAYRACPACVIGKI